jgi:uncharacterized protein (DUF488 family)
MARSDGVLTIGHSTHEAARLIALLEAHGVGTVVDVRSAPYSRHNPQHSREAMATALRGAGSTYLHLGEALGGRPRDGTLYDVDGHVR